MITVMLFFIINSVWLCLAEFVEKAHFGGGVLSRAGDGENSHRNLIDKLIAESKLRKYEQKQLKQETNELTEQLDKDWKELMPVVPTKNRGEMDNEDEPPAKKKVDKNSYDVLMRSLKFDRRGMVCYFLNLCKFLLN